MHYASLYIHMPWCIRKCPYCDFNSHKSPDNLNEQAYIDHLVADFKQDILQFGQRTISSVFIGGGTPSLFSAESFAQLFDKLHNINPIDSNIEITMEANPGTVEQQRFSGYRHAGINRLSLGIQSFNANHLKKLGRVHDDKQAHHAINVARDAGFNNINIDIMHGLPGQSVEQGINDLELAISYNPEHLSWYQLTLEPNTHFFKFPPQLPDDETLYQLEKYGLELLHDNAYERYEISAYCRLDCKSKHNQNYWSFGDYFGIGAGAHGKITSADKQIITRTQKQRQPTTYQDISKPYTCKQAILSANDICFEYMLNTTRLKQSHTYEHFTELTGQPIDCILPQLLQAEQKGFISISNQQWKVTTLGRRFTNDLQEIFLGK